MPRKKDTLTDMQQRFVDEYLVDLNAKQAAIRAGYSVRSAHNMGFRQLQKDHVLEAIQKAQQSRSARTQIDADYVLSRLGEIDQLDVADILDNTGNIKPVMQWPQAWRKSISGVDLQELMVGDTETVVRKIKMPDKLRNLDLIGKHVAVQAWKEQVEHDISDRAAALIAARKRVESARQ